MRSTRFGPRLKRLTLTVAYPLLFVSWLFFCFFAGLAILLAFVLRKLIDFVVRWQRALRWLAGIAAVTVVMISVLWILPDVLTRHPHLSNPADRYAAVGTTRIGLVAAVAAIGTAGGRAYTARTYRLSKIGQFTDRYTSALENLGHANLGVRTGGIYAFQRLMQEDANAQPMILDVLTTYVRSETIPWPETPVPSVEIVAAGIVIARRDPAHDSKKWRLNMAGVGLRGAELYRAPLEGVNLAGACLRECQLVQANLRLADLTGADLTNANLKFADMSHADLAGANLQGAQMRDGILANAKLVGTDLTGVDLSGVKGLTAWQLQKAVTDAQTKLPYSLDR